MFKAPQGLELEEKKEKSKIRGGGICDNISTGEYQIILVASKKIFKLERIAVLFCCPFSKSKLKLNTGVCSGGRGYKQNQNWPMAILKTSF